MMSYGYKLMSQEHGPRGSRATGRPASSRLSRDTT
jgi:hypothetical protein